MRTSGLKSRVITDVPIIIVVIIVAIIPFSPIKGGVTDQSVDL